MPLKNLMFKKLPAVVSGRKDFSSFSKLSVLILILRQIRKRAKCAGM